MSRPENYFHPVKNILSKEQTNSLIKFFYEHREGHYAFRENQIIEYWDGDWDGGNDRIKKIYQHYGYEKANVSIDLIKKNIMEINKLLINFYKNTGFSREGTHIALERLDLSLPTDVLLSNCLEIFKQSKISSGVMFHSEQTNPDTHNSFNTKGLIQDIVSTYKGDTFQFIETSSADFILARHLDPGRECCVTFPLIPDYSKYRECRFYDEPDESIYPNPTHIVDYSKIKAPVLLNTQKYHEISGNEDNLFSLCFQVCYIWKDYKTVRKELSESGLLI